MIACLGWFVWLTYYVTGIIVGVAIRGIWSARS